MRLDYVPPAASLIRLLLSDKGISEDEWCAIQAVVRDLPVADRALFEDRIARWFFRVDGRAVLAEEARM